MPKSQQIKSLAGIWRIDQLIEDAPADAWQRLSCGEGAKGLRVYDWAAAKLAANLIRPIGAPDRVLFTGYWCGRPPSSRGEAGTAGGLARDRSGWLGG
ncbi:hypothetical protein ABZ920_16575 [Streptomyces sp. NPDC046831]|uniref:hypothetical protein n=1 Tax=Streptomyces sp. NPDC046831 TaxID=3154805 RepID=UPI0033D8DC83